MGKGKSDKAFVLRDVTGTTEGSKLCSETGLQSRETCNPFLNISIGLQSTQMRSCTVHSSMPSVFTGVSQKRLQTVTFLSVFLL